MHTQSDTSTAITTAGGDHVFTVKGNTATAHRQLKALPWKDVPARSTALVSHGRRVIRTIRSLTAPDQIGFAGAAQVAQILRTVTTKGSKSIEVVYLITSADHHDAPPAVLAAWVQSHSGCPSPVQPWPPSEALARDRVARRPRTTRAGGGPHAGHLPVRRSAPPAEVSWAISWAWAAGCPHAGLQVDEQNDIPPRRSWH
jgi:hypothetical protein